jgi:hypothetical protein
MTAYEALLIPLAPPRSSAVDVSSYTMGRPEKLSIWSLGPRRYIWIRYRFALAAHFFRWRSRASGSLGIKLDFLPFIGVTVARLALVMMVIISGLGVLLYRYSVSAPSCHRS